MCDFDVIIIGGGAAGLMCAGESLKRGRSVLILEHGDKVGAKIRISGGGRANFTNLHTSPANFLSDNPRFCVSALKRYNQHDFIALIDRYGIAYHERRHGQLFCDGKAQQIIDMLLNEAKGVTVQTQTSAQGVQKSGDIFTVATNRGPKTARAVVIASGGPSIPKMGATGFAYTVAKSFGLNVIEPRSGLVPLTFDAKTLAKLDGLSGVSLDARVKLGKVAFQEALLFTHRGLSGPVILQISSYWHMGDAILVNLLPDIDVLAFLKEAKTDQPIKNVRTVLAQILPKSLAYKLCEWTNANGRLVETSGKTLRGLAQHVNAWSITPNGCEGVRTAEVTVGGVDTHELSSKTMEANAVPGLYFIGEAVDVTGHLGGFNFQWAWASAQACGHVN